MKLGEVIRTYRKRKGWTQGQLAIHADLNPEHIGMIERGQRQNPSIETVAALALALDASVDAILIEAGMLPPPPGNKPWSREVLIMQRLLNLYEPGSSERTHLEAIIIAQAEAYLALSGREDESDEVV
jgi:transcriptional regulator with XRE-family HTH domain